MAIEISNTDDVIDLRDAIERFEELESEREALEDRITDAEDADERDAARADLQEWDDGDEAEERDRLRALLDECKGNGGGDHQWRGDWYPVTLIAEHYFEDYARELAEDLHGNKIREAEWPFDCINWERAADALRVNYTTVDFDGETYLTR